MERGGDDEYRFKKALKTAKYAIEEICELSDRMEDEYGERMSSRMSERMSRRYSRRDDEMDERRGR